MSSDTHFFPASAYVKYRKKIDAQLIRWEGPDVVQLLIEDHAKSVLLKTISYPQYKKGMNVNVRGHHTENNWEHGKILAPAPAAQEPQYLLTGEPSKVMTMYKVKITDSGEERRVAAHNIKAFAFYAKEKDLNQADPTADVRHKIADAISNFGNKYTDAETQQLFKDVFKSIRHYKERKVADRNTIPTGVCHSIRAFLDEQMNKLKVVRTATIAKATEFKLLCEWEKYKQKRGPSSTQGPRKKKRRFEKQNANTKDGVIDLCDTAKNPVKEEPSVKKEKKEVSKKVSPNSENAKNGQKPSEENLVQKKVKHVKKKRDHQLGKCKERPKTAEKTCAKASETR